MSESVLASQKTDESNMGFSVQQHNSGEGVEATGKDKTSRLTRPVIVSFV